MRRFVNHRFWDALIEAIQTTFCPTERTLSQTLDRIETWA